MCSTCGAKTYGQKQDEAIRKDVAKLKKVRQAMQTRSDRKANAHLN